SRGRPPGPKGRAEKRSAALARRPRRSAAAPLPAALPAVPGPPLAVVLLDQALQRPNRLLLGQRLVEDAGAVVVRALRPSLLPELLVENAVQVGAVLDREKRNDEVYSIQKGAVKGRLLLARLQPPQLAFQTQILLKQPHAPALVCLAGEA